MGTRYLLFQNYIPEMFKGESSKLSGNLIVVLIIGFCSWGLQILTIDLVLVKNINFGLRLDMHSGYIEILDQN